MKKKSSSVELIHQYTFKFNVTLQTSFFSQENSVLFLFFFFFLDLRELILNCLKNII